MTLKRSLVIAHSVENMDLSIIKANYNVFLRQMKTGDDALVWCDMFNDAFASFPPGSFDQILLFEMRSVADGLRSSFDAWAARC